MSRKNHVSGGFVTSDIDVVAFKAELGWKPHGLTPTILKKTRRLDFHDVLHS